MKSMMALLAAVPDIHFSGVRRVTSSTSRHKTLGNSPVGSLKAGPWQTLGRKGEVMIKAGSAICSITPDFPAMMCGYPTSQVSTGVHDKLYASALYLECGGQAFIYITSDLCYYSRSRSDQILAAVEAATGVETKHIILCAIHTHSGPMPSCNPYEGNMGPEMYPEYMDQVMEKIAAIAKEAKETAFPAKIGYGTGYCGKEQGVGGNRHDPNYDADPSVLVFAVQDMEGNLRACFTNYALHPTVIHAENTLISADYVGYTRLAVNEKYPKAVFGFVQGCSGNQSTRFFRHGQTFEEAERIGRAIGNAVVDVLDNMQFCAEDVKIAFADLDFYPSQMREIPSKEEALANAEKAKREYDELVANKAPYSVCRSAECTLIGANVMVKHTCEVEKYGKEKVIANGLPVRMRAVRVGDWAVVAISAELFVEIGLSIKKASPFKETFVSAVSLGNTVGYICSDYAYDQYCYEPQGSLFCRGIAGEVIEAAGKLLQSLA
jgi:neutral ceramidase